MTRNFCDSHYVHCCFHCHCPLKILDPYHLLLFSVLFFCLDHQHTNPTTPPKIVSTIYFFRRHIENPCKLANIWIFIHEDIYNLNRDTTQSSKTLEQPHETPQQDPRTLLLARTQYYNVRTDRRLQHRDTYFRNRNCLRDCHNETWLPGEPKFADQTGTQPGLSYVLYTSLWNVHSPSRDLPCEKKLADSNIIFNIEILGCIAS